MGWASGLQAGMRLGEAIRQGQLERDLAEEAKKYKVTEGAYGPAVAENLQGVISARDQALQGLGEGATPEQIQQVHEQYTPAMAELSRRVGLTAPDYSVASGPQNYATMQEAQRAAAPLRTEGLAGVYERYGDTTQANALRGQALQQQAAGLQVKKLEREDVAEDRYTQFSDYASQNPNLTADQLSEAATKQFKLNTGQLEKYVTQRLNIDKAKYDQFKVKVETKLQGKNLAQLGELYNTDPDFDDKTDLAIVPGKGGAVTLNFIDKATNTVTGSQTFKNEALATEYLNTKAVSPQTLGTWMLGTQAKEATIEASKASTAKDIALGGLYSSGSTAGGPKTGAAKVKDFVATMGREPTEAEKLTMLGVTAKTGTGVRGLQMPVTLQKNDDGTQTAFSKETGEPAYNVYRGQKLPIGTSVTDFNRMTTMAKDNGVQLALGENDAGGLELRYIGADGKGYTDPEKAKYAKAPDAAGTGGKGGIDTSGKGGGAKTGEAEKKYIRSPNPRGGYTYTVSPRGLTRAQWEERDNK